MFSGSSNISTLIIVLVSLIISMAIHEAMHAYVSHALGDRTAFEEGRLTLNPLKHIDVFTTILLPLLLILGGYPPIFAAKPVPFDPRNVRYEEFGVALVGLAGPFTNLALAVLASIFLHIFSIGTGTSVYELVTIFMQVNIGFFVFNMIPFPPLDGSRLLYAVAPDPVRRVMEQIEGMGFMAVLVFIFVAFTFLSPIISNIINAIYVFLLR